MLSRHRSLLMAAAVAVCVSPLASAADHGLSVALTSDRAAVTTSDDVNVRFTITNEGSRARSVFLPN